MCKLALNNSWTRVDIASRSRPVKLEEDTRIGGLVSTGEGNQAARVERPGATSDRDLGAGDIDLGTTDAGGPVQGNVFDAEEVLAVGDAAGDLHRDF